MLDEQERMADRGSRPRCRVRPRSGTWSRSQLEAAVGPDRARAAAGRAPPPPTSNPPRTTSCQNEETRASVRPLSMTARMRTAIVVPRIVPRPPDRLAPPRMTAVKARNSRPCAVVGDVAPSEDTTMSEASPTTSPVRRKPLMTLRAQVDARESRRCRVRAHRGHVAAVAGPAHDRPEDHQDRRGG